jgi:cell division protein YceG involved in septum cleavage
VAPDSSQHPIRTEGERERDRAERARRRAERSSAGDPAGPPQQDRSAVESTQPPILPLPPPAGGASADGQLSPAPVAQEVEVPRPPVASPPVASAAPILPSQPSRPSGGRRGRSWFARILALLALVLVAVAVWLAVDGLKGAKHTKAIALPAVVHVLIPEGETRRQIAARAHLAGLRDSYLTASKRSPLLHPTRYGAPPGTPNLEGFLFPATYDLYRGDPARRLVREQLIAFTENFGDEEVRRARELHVTPYQLLIVASMVEREAQLAGDRSKVAAVIYNRLRLNMPLGIDATIRYALDDYTHPLTSAQLGLDSPYNTRIHRGLPPTPISNPGLASIHAAAHPAHVSYLYYVAGADGCGEQVFSTSFAQFEQDAAAYQRALRANGGHVPTCRKKS